MWYWDDPSGLSIYIMCFYVIHAYGRKHFLLFYSSFNHFIFFVLLLRTMKRIQ